MLTPHEFSELPAERTRRPRMVPRRHRLTAGGLIALLSILGACGDEGYANVVESSSDDGATEESDDTTTTTDATTTSTTSTTTSTTTTVVDEVPVPESSPGQPAGSTQFVDPEGLYQLQVSPDWIPSHGSLALGIELWLTDVTSGANINILSQQAGPYDTAAYLDLNAETLDQQLPGAVLGDYSITTGSAGQQLGQIEFTQEGMQFLQVYTVGGGNATVVTFTTDPALYPTQRAEILPYLLTVTSLP